MWFSFGGPFGGEKILPPKLEQFRRPYEREGEDVNGKHGVSVCLFGCLFDHQSQIEIGEHFKNHFGNNIYFPEHQLTTHIISIFIHSLTQSINQLIN
jgi:hypothetical protein